MASDAMLLKNVTILDGPSGQIVFQRVYSWRNVAAFSNLGSLIQVFYQFAREVDDGVINSIDFQAPTKNTIRRKRDDVLKTDRSESMQMMSAKTEDFMVSVFFDLSGKIEPSTVQHHKFQTLLGSIRQAFEIRYLPTLLEWRASTVGQPAPQEPNAESSTAPAFDALDEIVDKLKDGIMEEVELSGHTHGAVAAEVTERVIKDHLRRLGITAAS